MTTRFLVVLAGTNFCLWADDSGRRDENRVTVCMERAGSLILTHASNLVSRMYAAIGVEIGWRLPRNCPPSRIRVAMNDLTSPAEKPHALAYSMPYKGTRIVVFYDRILERYPPLVPVLTGHVIAHEIGHILQGSMRHSASGVMKAEWDKDLLQMTWKPLTFSDLDVSLIHRGLDDRANRWRVPGNPP